MQGQLKRKFSAEFKTRIVLDVLSGRSSVAALARRYRIKDKLIYEWRDQALARLPQVFSRCVGYTLRPATSAPSGGRSTTRR